MASMTHCHGLCHRKCDLRYVGGVIEFIKLDFGVLKANSMSKMPILGD